MSKKESNVKLDHSKSVPVSEEESEQSEEVVNSSEDEDEQNEKIVPDQTNEIDKASPIEKKEEDKKSIYSSKKSGSHSSPSSKKEETGDLPRKKTIFTKISENLYDKFMSNNKFSSQGAYDMLTSQSFVSIQQCEPSKGNKEKFNDMMSRHAQYEEMKNQRLKERKDKLQQKLKADCTWTPKKEKVVQPRKPEVFYDEQKQFLVERKKRLEEMQNEKVKREKEEHKGKLVSENSKKIVSNKRGSEKEDEFFQRLQREKLKTLRPKMIKEGENKNNDNKNTIKKSKKEINELTQKLYNESEEMRKTRKMKTETYYNKEQKEKREVDLISDSTKKILLDKFISQYEKVVVDLFNKSDNENFTISFDEYLSLLKNISCINEGNKRETALAKESFDKFLQSKDGHIEIHAFVLFGLTFLGMYKGNPLLEENDKSNEKEKEKKETKKQSSFEFIKLCLPELDLNKYQYPPKVAMLIKKRFLPFCQNITKFWSQENSKRRQDKMQKRLDIQGAEEKSKNSKQHRKNEEKVESSRKRMFEQATKGVDSDNEFQDATSLSPNSKQLKEKISKNQLKIEDVYQILQKRKERELANLRAKREKEEFKECTFQPNATTKPVNIKDISANIEKLYTDGKITHMKKLRMGDKDPYDNKEIEQQCTFAPEIHSMNELIFKLNPLEKDEKLLEKLTKLEEFRVKKNFSNMQSLLRGNTLSQFQDGVNEMENRVSSPMKFGIEIKSNKDTFDNFERRKHRKEGVAPLLKVEVNIDDNNKIEKLEIYPGDDADKITEEFCNKHGLGEDKKKRLQKIIQQKLNESNNDNFSASQHS